MKAKKLIVLLLAVAATCIPVVAGQEAKSTKSPAARAVVVSLYNQHKRQSPFFQRRSRALLDKYFTRELATWLWRDALSAKDEVGALDGDPLFNAQEMEITNFVIHDGTFGARGTEVPVSFKNLGKPHQIIFRLVPVRGAWKIANIEYDDGASLAEILKRDRDEVAMSQSIKVYLVAVGDEGRTGKKIGCGDSLVAVTHTIKKTAAPLTAAIRELLATPQRPAGSPKLENFWKGRNLKVQSVSISKQSATIHISGELSVAGVCDQPRIESQIEETARQFPTVKRVKVYVGRRTLAAAIR